MFKGVGNRQRKVELRHDDKVIAIVELHNIQVNGTEYVPERVNGCKVAHDITLGGTSVALAENTSLTGYGYRLTYGDKVWLAKPEGIFTRKVAITTEDGVKLGGFTPLHYFKPWLEMDVEMPEGSTPEAQAFLLWVFLQILDMKFSD